MNHPRGNIMGSGGNQLNTQEVSKQGGQTRAFSIEGMAPFGQNTFHRCSKGASHDKMHKKTYKTSCINIIQNGTCAFCKSQQEPK